jgi:hypothetical protein
MAMLYSYLSDQYSITKIGFNSKLKSGTKRMMNQEIENNCSLRMIFFNNHKNKKIKNENRYIGTA